MAESVYLMGDEDGGVSLYCRETVCYLQGASIAYYAVGEEGHDGFVFDGTPGGRLIPLAETIVELLYWATKHTKDHHAT